MTLETPIISIQKSPEKVFDFLMDLNNFERIMPSNKEKFVVEGDSFLLGLYGVPDIRMIITEKKPHNKVVLGAASSKLDFTLTIDLSFADNGNTNAQVFFNGNFNPMVAMMVKTPLTNFIKELGENLKTI